MWRTGACSEQYDPKEDGADFDVSAFDLIGNVYFKLFHFCNILI